MASRARPGCSSTTPCSPASSRSRSGSPSRERSTRSPARSRGLPETRQAIGAEAKQSSGIKQEILLSVQRRLKEVPSGRTLFQTLRTIGITAFEIGIGIFFVFAVAGYWIFERERAMNSSPSCYHGRSDKLVRDTWLLIDLKLGAYVRGRRADRVHRRDGLSLLFWAIGLPYWLLIGCFAGFVEIVPVVGPLAACGLAVGVGLTESFHLALLALSSSSPCG